MIEEPMTLVPFSDLNQWLEDLEHVIGDQAYLSKMAISRQQLQRRLHKFGWSFSSITNYVLCNQAIKHMQADLSVKEIAE
ncbi:hypothetical protein NHN17_08260 [Photobacterium sp. ZSDE20]|uniref:Uncharacterized protein n=2 Tax=Photobacterium pectinilyticum TaxID=2906793 RepID=A0ABT1N2F1_9GAMM|nr:hypothetical protein [Photobacterium sp. ZSDE20]